MEIFTIDVPAVTMAIESRGIKVELDLGAIPRHMHVAKLMHGYKQTVADAASGAGKAAWFEMKGEDAPAPSRDQMRDFTAGPGKATTEKYTLAMMTKARDAILAGEETVARDGGTVTRISATQAYALALAKEALTKQFATALAKVAPNATPAPSTFIKLDPKIAAYFKANEKRATWLDTKVMEWIEKQLTAAKPRDFMGEAMEEMARREAASAEMVADLDELLDGL